MRKLLALGACALGISACDPDIKQDAPTAAATATVAEFDPSASPAIVPSPNDLALNRTTGLVEAPINPTMSAAEQEFTRDYLNTLNGFPTSAIANTLVKNLDARTVTEATVKFIALPTGTTASPKPPKPATPIIAYNENTNRINIIPPQPQGWPKGGRYAVAIIGGENGVKTKSGDPIIGSATWAFATSETSLVKCPNNDLTSPQCVTATELIPSSKTDATERLADQTASALRLEQVRLGYAPLLDLVSQTYSVDRKDIVLLWTFTIMDQPEATFDPTRSVVPFPNDLVRTPATATAPAHLNLPIPAGASPTVQALFGGLNTLDGFSTTGGLVSENGDNDGALTDGAKIDPATLDSSVLVVKLTNRDTGTQPNVKACLDCTSSLKPDGSTPTNPQQLQLVPTTPLDPATQYGGVVTRGLKDTAGRGVAPAIAFALLRISVPLVDANGKSQIPAVPDGNAAALEPIRAGMKPLFDGLAAGGLERKNVALAWAFTTQSITSIAQQLAAAPSTLPLAAALPADPAYLVEQTATIKGRMDAAGLPRGDVGQAFLGAFTTAVLLDDTQGTLNRAVPRFDRIPFILTLPSTTMPTEGYPVVVFGHGLTGNYLNVLALTNTLNKAGYAVAAFDVGLHGDRSSCVGAASVIPSAPSDDAACAQPAAQKCDTTVNSATFGRCIARSVDTRIDCSATGATPADLYCSSQGQGRCAADKRCEGGTFLAGSTGAAVISGWNFLNLGNLFATRDNFRQQIIDFSQFSRVLASTGVNTYLNAQGGKKISGAKFHYVGQSLGGILGTLTTSVSPNVVRSVHNVTGGNLVNVLLTATNPDFVARRQGFLNFLGSAGITSGTPAFDQFINLARTILDPADPLNYAYNLENAANAPAGRDAFVQYVRGDTLIPNPVTADLLRAANRSSSQKTVAEYMFSIPAYDNDTDQHKRHAFFLNLALTEAQQAQAQVVAFLNSGSVVPPAAP